MALTDKTAPPQPASGAQPLPARVPEWPEDLMERFPSMRAYVEEYESFWRRVRNSLYETQDLLGFQVSDALVSADENAQGITNVYGDIEATATAVADLQLEVEDNGDSITALAVRTDTLESQVQTPSTGLLARVSVIESTYATESWASSEITTAVTAGVAAAADYTDDEVADGVASATGYTDSEIASLAGVYTTQSAFADATGYLEGKYTLTVTAGDVVTGMNISSASDGGTNISQVIFQANKFQIYNGSSGLAVFDLSGSDIRLAADVTILGNLDVGSGINRAFVGEFSSGNYTIRRGVASGNRVEMYSNAGGGSDDYSQFRAYNSAGVAVSLIGTEAAGGSGIARLADNTGTENVILNGDSGRVSFAESARGPLGSAANPVYSFTASATDGLYSAAAADLAVTLGGGTSFNFRRSGNSYSLEVGASRAATGNAFIDLVGDTTYTDYGLRFFRDTASSIIHSGVGALSINAKDAGSVYIQASGSTHLAVTPTGASASTFYSGAITAPNITATNLHTTTIQTDANLAAGKLFKINGTQVVGPRGSGISSLGSTSISGTGDDAGINAAFESHKNAVNALINRLVTHGLIS